MITVTVIITSPARTNSTDDLVELVHTCEKCGEVFVARAYMNRDRVIDTGFMANGWKTQEQLVKHALNCGGVGYRPAEPEPSSVVTCSGCKPRIVSHDGTRPIIRVDYEPGCPIHGDFR